MDRLPPEIRARILQYLASDLVERAAHGYFDGYAHLARLARVNRSWNSAALPWLYRTFEERLMDREHIDLLIHNVHIHPLVERISVSLLDLCRTDKDELMYTAATVGQDPSQAEFDYDKETEAIEYDLSLSRIITQFANATRLDIDTCVWDSADYRRSKYTLHALLSFACPRIRCLTFNDVEHWEGMMLISQFVRAIPHLEELRVHIRFEGEYRDVWQREDFRWTTKEHFTCVQMCRAVAEASQLKLLDFGDMCLAMNHPDRPARNFASACHSISLGPQSSAGPIIHDMILSSREALQHVRLDPENLVQAGYYCSTAAYYFPKLHTLHLDGLNPETDYPGTLTLFAGSPIRELKLDGYVDIGSVTQWINNDELPQLRHVDIDLMDYCSQEVGMELRDACDARKISVTLEAWPAEEQNAEERLEDYLG